MDFQKNNAKRKERMKNRETESSGQWAQHKLWYPEDKTGESIVPLGLQNNTIKRGEGLRSKRRKFLEERIIEKVLSRRKNSEKLVKLLLGILEKATVAHTRIQKESNFASLRGLNNHIRL